MKTVLKETYDLNVQNIDAVSSKISDILSEYPYVSQRDVLRTRLSAEEILLNWITISHDLSVELIAEEKGRNLELSLVLDGISYPVKSPDSSADTTSSFVDSTMANLGIDWIYQFHHGQNSAYISIEIKRSRIVQKVFGAMAFAIVIGIVMRILPKLNYLGIQDILIEPLINICSQFLTAIVSPMMLIAVISGVLSVGSPRILNQIGKHVCLRFFWSMFLIILSAGALCVLFFGLETVQVDVSGFTVITDFLATIVPNNIFSPFIEGNMLQIVFLGVIIGLAMLFLQRRVGLITKIVDEANSLVLKVLSGFEKFLPAVVFLSMLDTVLSLNADSIIKYIKVFLIFIVFISIVTALQFLRVSRHTGISCGKLWKILKPSFVVQLASASSSAAFNESYEACEKDFGIDKKLVSFALPIGTVIYKPFIAAEFVFVTFATQYIFGDGMDIGSLLLLMLLSLLVSMAYPPVSGGEITCYTLLLAHMGMSSGLLAIVCALSTLFDPLEAPCNTICTELQLLLTAKKHGFINEKKENGKC